MKINVKRVVSVELSVVNIAMAFPFCFIVVEYYKSFTKGKEGLFQFNFNNMPFDHIISFDVATILLSLSVIIFSLLALIKYFRNKKMPLVTPIIITVIYSAFWTASYFNNY